jgi:23S rRNA pseudouridine1911/1915/1917 synthase
VEIKTGRTHQIRVHLASIKHPVVGDKVYSAGRENTISNPQIRAALRKLDRQFLHAAKLGFQHPSTGEKLLFESPLPEDLTAFITAIESDADMPKS